MAYLTYGLHQREGLIIVTGDVGTGKTTLVDYLAEQLSAGPFVPGRVSAGQIEPSHVLQLVAKAFQLPIGETSQAELQEQIEQFLITRQKVRQRPLLIVDEAQHWPLAALEELRMLANLHHGGRALMQALLVGQPQFREALGETDYEQIRQRVVASHHLEMLDETEIGPYIEHRLKQVGWQGDPSFEADACAAIFEHCQGVPRRINLVCSRLLVLGALEESHVISADDVQEVLEELDQEGAPYEPVPMEEQGDASPTKEAPQQEASGTNGPVRLNGKAKEPVATGASASANEPWSDLEHWRREAVRLMQKLEQAYDGLATERRQLEAIRLENDQLRLRLHQMELEQSRRQVEETKRSAAVLIKSAPSKATIFRRFGSS